MRYRLLVALAIVVAVLLPVSAIASSPGHHPYESWTDSYEIARESTTAYERMPTDPERATAVEDLSPDAQRLFRDALEQPRDGDGWRSLEIEVCGETMVVCDEYAESPEFPTPRTPPEQDSKATIEVGTVEYEGEYYVVKQTDHVPNGMGMFVETAMAVVVLGSYGLFLGGLTFARGKSSPAIALGFTAFGVLLIAWPYVLMVADAEVSPVPLAVIAMALGFVYLLETRLRSN